LLRAVKRRAYGRLNEEKAMAQIERLRAAQYTRASTEHQRYSTQAQKDVIARYAAERGIEVIRSYDDEGRSGLTLNRRAGLQALLRDVIGKSADFGLILVLDVSRWGRFQDPDQAAHYEFLCREASVQVHYCQEMFENDGSLANSLLKHLKRIMAGEYSQELSRKVSQAQLTQAALGHKQGGSAPYGFRRALVDEAGQPILVLERGDRKALKNHRVTYVLGPPHEVAAVNWIFEMYADQCRTTGQICDALNAAGLVNVGGRAWEGHNVRAVLRHELAVGVYVFNRTTQRLRTPVQRLPPEEWVRTKVMDESVPVDVFDRAFARRTKQGGNRRITNAEIRAGLRRLFEEKGNLTSGLINACPYLPSSNTIVRKLGPLQPLLVEAGGVDRSHRPRTDGSDRYTDAYLLDRLRTLLAKRGRLSRNVIEAEPDMPTLTSYIQHFGTIRKAYALIGYALSFSDLCSAGQQDWQRLRIAKGA
jgi:DNA invertase Pin-like site-specific DNA recombinase